MRNRLAILIALACVWPSTVVAEKIPSTWYNWLNWHLAREPPIRAEPLDPLTLAYSFLPICIGSETRACRNTDRLTEAIETALSWWRDRDRSKLEKVLSLAWTEDQEIAVRQLQAIEHQVRQTVEALANNPEAPRTPNDIWTYSLLVVGFDRLYLSNSMESLDYWGSNEGASWLEKGHFARFIGLQLDAATYYAASVRLARLCEKVDPGRDNELCLAFLSYDETYAAAASRYAEVMEQKLIDADRAITTIGAAHATNPDQFPILLGEYLASMSEAHNALRKLVAEDRAGFMAYGKMTEDALRSAEKVAKLEAAFGSPTKYRTAVGGN